MDPEQVSQEFVDAVDARDVDRVVGCFNTDAVIHSDAGHVIAQGEKATRTHFGQFIARSPDLHVKIPSRIDLGSWVVQEEHTTGLVLEEPVSDFRILVAYRVEDGKILKTIGLF
jgi:hypothetical protein